jgi:23S rRNA (adenine2503-C2)-methyltransferase
MTANGNGERKEPLIGMTAEELRALMEEAGQPAYRGNQLAEWLYRRNARSFDDMTNLPAALRTFLSGRYETGRSTVVARRQSGDDTVKLLLEYADGARVEAVGLPYEDRFFLLSLDTGRCRSAVFSALRLGRYVRN